MFTGSTRSCGAAPPMRVRPGRNPHRFHLIQHRRFLRGSSLVLLTIGCLLALLSSGSAAEEEIPVLDHSEISSALVVDIEARCSEIQLRSPEAKVRWSVDRSMVSKSANLDFLLASDEFRIDVSEFPGGLELGRFESIAVSGSASRSDQSSKALGPRSATHSAVARDLSPGVYYHVRVLVRTPDGWVASSPIGFLSSVCPADGIDGD